MARLRNPWPEGYSINKNSPYGYRIHPITKQRKFHQGVDVAGSFPVTAAADGRVKKIGWSASGGGNTVLIDHGDVVTVYYHGAHRTELEVGQEIKAGTFIYTSGTTGSSTGNHLHFEVRRGPEMGGSGAWGDTLDPEDFLPGKNETPTQKPQEPVSAPQPVSEPDTPKTPEKPSESNLKPKSSLGFLNKAAPGLKAWSNSWIKRGEKK